MVKPCHEFSFFGYASHADLPNQRDAGNAACCADA
jgi:hypothetical protein